MWSAGSLELNTPPSWHWGVPWQLNDLGFPLQSTKPSRTAQKTWDISQRNSQLPILVLVFIWIQTSELCTDFWYKWSDMLCMYPQACVHLYVSLAYWCILQHRYFFSVYFQDSGKFWHFGHVSYSCSCEAGFPQKDQQPSHRECSGNTGSRWTSSVDERHYSQQFCRKH